MALMPLANVLSRHISLQALCASVSINLRLHLPLPCPTSIDLPRPALVAGALSALEYVPRWLSEIWDSVLRAVPKKKTSYSKKRSRFLAGKGLKDVIHLTRCTACGRVKRLHVLCPYCVSNIKDMWKKNLQTDGSEGKPVREISYKTAFKDLFQKSRLWRSRRPSR